MEQPGGAVPPPMAPVDQQQYHYHLQQQHFPPPQQQQWLMMPPQQPQQPPLQPQAPQIWGQQASQYGIAPTSTAASSGSNETCSLWIGNLQPWMDENYLSSCFFPTGELVSVKLIRNKQTSQSDCYGFLEFRSRAAAENVLLTYNGKMMPNVEQHYRLNWATPGVGERHTDDSADYSIFVGDLAADVTDYVLQETFKAVYSSVKGAKVVFDRSTGRSKGYGFVSFGDESEQIRAMTEMNGVLCSTRPMRIGPAANKKPVGVQQYQKAPNQNTPGNEESSDPNNTTIFVGGLDPNVTDEHLRQLFGQYGELIHVKIPVGKRCGFVQFTNRASAEQALGSLNGTPLGSQNIRLSWGHGPSNKQSDKSQNGGYYGYTQGHEAYAYAPPPQDPNVYYGGYPGYTNYQQPQQ